MRSRRKPRRPAGKGRRNLLVFGFILAGLAILIVVVGLLDRTPKPIMPPESPEISKKREAPENAFYAVWDAAQKVPPIPPALSLPVKLKNNPGETYFAEPGSVGDLMKIHRPDDDKALVFYVLSCRPAVEKLRQALETEYFLYPRIGTPEDTWRWNDQVYWGPFFQLARILVAFMRLNARIPQHEHLSPEFFSDALRFSQALGSDGALGHYQMAETMLAMTVRDVPECARNFESVEPIRRMLASVQAITLHEQPLQPYLEFSWRSLDNLAVQKVSGEFRHGPAPHQILEWWMLRKQCRFLRNQKEELLELAVLSWPEYKQLDEEDYSHLFGGWRFSYGDFFDIKSLLASQARIEQSRAGCIVALCLELYRREHGQYPEALDELVPEYLDDVPIPPVEGEPFVYEVEGDDYWLYPGPKRDDLLNMNPKARRRHVVHCPENLSHEEAKAM